MSTFFSMHGYGVFVWSAYSITFFVFVINLFFALHENKKIKRKLNSRDVHEPSA